MAKLEYQKSRRPPDTVDEALDRFWVDGSIPGHVPDYAGFTAWIGEKEQAARLVAPLPIHAQATSVPLIQLAWELLKSAEAEGIEITSEGATPDPKRFGKRDGKKSTLKSLNRGKLLLSFFSRVSPRQLEMFLMMAKPADPASSISPSSSQSEHRAEFFRAVALGDEHMAFKMVGRLREEEHDIGELAFLEATASFHSNRFDEAIQHARNVPKGAIDWSRAFMLLLESQALQGDIEALSAEIQASPEFSFPQFFIPYICQIVVENSPTPEESFKQADALINEVADRSQPGIGAFKMWNRHSCELAVQFVEHQRELALRHLAVTQGGGEADAQSWEDVPRRVQQVACALAVDADLASKLSEVTLDSAYQEIVKRLMNYSQPERIDYLRALVVQWRIGDHAVFLENVIANLDVLVADSTPEAWQFIVWAYQEAQVLKRTADTELLRRRLVESPTMARKLSEVETVVGTDRLERQLSPMGKLALRSSNWDLLQAEDDSRLWRDAGMISLGFFRILELEFNERLILPMLHAFDLDTFEQQFKILKTGELRGSTKKAVDFWEKMIVPLRRAKLDRKGLELGTLENLLRKVAEVSGVDSALKTGLHSGLIVRLSPKGIDAFKSGHLARLVDGSERERFRNPPAHSRYVNLATARDCKSYTINALDQLIAYTMDVASRNSTIH